MRALTTSVVFSLFLISCGLLDLSDPSFDKSDVQSDRIDLPAGKTSSSDSWIFCEGVQIDLTKYEKIDSIIFIPNLRSQSKEMKCVADLFNYTTNSIINQSNVESQLHYILHLVRSQNLINSIPKSINEVGIRFKSTDLGHHVEVGVKSHLIIYYR